MVQALFFKHMILHFCPSWDFDQADEPVQDAQFLLTNFDSKGKNGLNMKRKRNHVF